MIVAASNQLLIARNLLRGFSETRARDLSCSLTETSTISAGPRLLFSLLSFSIQAIAGFTGRVGNCLIMQNPYFLLQIGDGRSFFFLLQQVDITIADPDIRFDRARRHERRKEVVRDSVP